MKKQITYSAPMLVAGADGKLHVNYTPPEGGELVKLHRVSTEKAYIRLAG